MSEETIPLQVEVDPRMIAFINQKMEEYRAQGVAELEASAAANADWEAYLKKTEEEGEEIFQKLAKDVGLAELIDDQLRRALGLYKAMFDKQFAPQTIDFKLQLKARGKDDLAFKEFKGIHKRLIAEATLILEVGRNGVWQVFRQKTRQFSHIGEMREGHRWKLQLYEAMLHDVIGWGITQYINVDDIRKAKAAESNGSIQ